jgi:hypothetical protein
MRSLYGALPTMQRMDFGSVLGAMSTNGDQTLHGVRCCGRAPVRGETAPRMHNKFLILCERAGLDSEFDPDLRRFDVHPRAVWTGSFNLTRNATRSFENAVLIHEDEIALAYFYQYQQIAALSEPLDWQSAEPNPEWRLGT